MASQLCTLKLVGDCEQCFRHWPVLPVHDSFIMHHGFEGELMNTMNEAFKDQFGKECRIEPKVSVLDIGYDKIDKEIWGIEKKQQDDTVLNIYDLLEYEKVFGTHTDLLSQHWSLKSRKKPKIDSTGVADTWDED